MLKHILSVPHSGTHTLCKVLYNKEYLIGYYHFGYHHSQISAFYGEAHIPIRDPVEILMSHHSRGKKYEDALRSMDALLTFVNKPRSGVSIVFHKIEDISIRRGHKGEKYPKDRQKAEEVLQEWLNPRKREFWGKFYPQYQNG